MQALILAGGEGTRLRPLTSTIPKPVVPLANQPHIMFMIEWLRRHGVEDVVLSCGFLADGVRRVLEARPPPGVRIRYVEEPEPLGTGGALRYAGELLEERFLMLNGDLLTDLDLTAQLAQHERTGARATLALYPVEDPSMYGLVRLRDDLSVRGFLEKPAPEEIDTNLINAGAYVLERSILEEMPPPGTNVSIEREVFPRLVGHGLYGFVAQGYWLDIGTPERYLQAPFDILEGAVETDLGRRLTASSILVEDGAVVEGRVVGPALVGAGCRVAAGAVVGARVALGAGVRVGPGARIESSVLLAGSEVGAQATITNSVVGPEARVGERCRLEDRVLLGEGVQLGAGNRLRAGARVFPGVSLPDGAIRR
jgi:mannose-1-phosphate guanylyltransferase